MIASPFPRLRAILDMRPASWLLESADDTGSGGNVLLPAGFEAYARVPHPALSPSGEPVRWATVASWAGRALDVGAQFAAISQPAAGAGRGPRP